MSYLTTHDLSPFASIETAKAEAMISDAEAQAVMVAPCLADESVVLTEAQRAAVRAVLRRAVLRWHEVGTGVVTQQTAGAWSQTTDAARNAPRSLFWPSELADLQAICKAAGGDQGAGSVFTIETGRRRRAVHLDVCSLAFGGGYCSCGSDINRYEGPIFGAGSDVG